MKKLIAAALALLLSLAPFQTVYAQQGAGASERTVVTLARKYNLASTSYIYVAYGDASSTASANYPLSGVLGPGTVKSVPVSTSGSSTTVAAVTASTEPFVGIAVDDLLLFVANDTTSTLPMAGIEFERVVTARASSDSVTVDAAIDLTATTTGPGVGGWRFRYKKFRTGTGATNGWFDVSKFSSFQLQWDVLTLNATDITADLECRSSRYAEPVVLTSNTFTAVGSYTYHVTTPWAQCRTGLKLTGDTGTQAVSIYFEGAR